MQRLAAILALGLLAACQTAREQEATQLNEADRKVRAAADACWRQADASAEAQELGDLLPPRRSTSPSMSLLANKQIPTARQAQTLIRFHDQYRTRCQEITVTGLRTVHPALADLVAKVHVVSNAGYAKLASQQVTWGDYAAFSAKLNVEYDKQWAAAQQQINNDLNARR